MHRYWLGFDIIQILMLLETCTGPRIHWEANMSHAHDDGKHRYMERAEYLFQDNVTVQDVRLETSSHVGQKRLSSGGRHDDDMASSDGQAFFGQGYHIVVSEHCKRS